MRPLKPSRRDTPEALTPLACRRTAMDLLARREHARRELHGKLAERGFDPAVIDPVLDELAGDGLLDESRFVESFVASRLRRGQGPVRIRAELAERGVAPSLVDDGLAQAGADWLARGAEVCRARFGAEPPADYKGWARQARFLQYRGFTTEQIRRILDRSADD